jgi:hypothetical protein
MKQLMGPRFNTSRPLPIGRWIRDLLSATPLLASLLLSPLLHASGVPEAQLRPEAIGPSDTRAVHASPAVQTPSQGGAPALLRAHNPLEHPRPLDVTVTPPEAKEPAQKLRGWLDAAGKTSGDGELVRVIVYLGADDSGARGELAQRDAIAVLEHEFARTSTDVGFLPVFGLEHTPVVVGDIEAIHLLKLAENPFVLSISPDLPIVFHRAEGAALMGVPAFRNQTGRNGAGVGIAIVDSGIDATHGELTGQIVANGDFRSPGGTDYSDSEGHGTMVAGVAAGKTGGIAPGARLWNAKVSTAASILSALDSLYSNRNSYGGLHIVNMSFGFPDLLFTSDCDTAVPPFTAAVEKLHSAGILVFVSAGNQAMAAVSFPSCLSKVISVGAVYDGNIGPAIFSDCSDLWTAADKITCYSNSAPPLDILAPSHCARTTARGGAYESCFGGTSAAAPYAAGVAALLKSVKPEASASQIRNALTSTGKQITDVTAITRPRVDIAQAYAFLNSPTCAAQEHATACGRTTTGTISSADCTTSSGYYYEWWSVPTSAGQPISITATSSAFRPYLHLNRPDGTLAAQSGSGTLSFVADQSGTWWIQATSWDKGVGGTYQLSVSCTTTISSSCTPGPQTACLLNNRFKATVRYRGAFDNGAPDTNASVKSVTGFGSAAYETAFFYFNNANNIEVLLKMLDQGNMDSQNRPAIAVLFGSATPLKVEITITDTKNGAVKRYTNDFGKQSGQTDFTAFVK